MCFGRKESFEPRRTRHLRPKGQQRHSLTRRGRRTMQQRRRQRASWLDLWTAGCWCVSHLICSSVSRVPVETDSTEIARILLVVFPISVLQVREMLSCRKFERLSAAILPPLPLLGTARTERTSIAFLRAIAEHVSCGVALGSSEFIA